jgi:hypothetical protein
MTHAHFGHGGSVAGLRLGCEAATRASGGTL